MTAAAEGGAGRAPAEPGSRAGAGTKLKAAREARGLSIGDVAQQLKLAPRQVQALEDDDYARLPGRTFVRGFARNYARFLHLDPGAVLALLPAADAAPALERPGLGPSRRPMGELPLDRAQRPSRTRWMFPLLLVVIVVAAGYYEYLRQHGMLRAPFLQRAGVAGEPAANTAMPAGAAPAALPNPLAANEPADGKPSRGASAAAGEGGTPEGTSAAPAAPGGAPASNPAIPAAAPVTAPAGASTTAPAAASAIAPAAGSAPAPAAAAAPAATGTAKGPGSAPAGTAATAPLVLTFKGASWVEVRDASGRVILKATEAAGTTRSVDGAPPFQLTLGDAPKVAVTFRGRPFDLGPYTRGDVARVTLE